MSEKGIQIQKLLQDKHFAKSAQEFNNRQGYSVDTIRRLEAIFFLPFSKEGESGRFSRPLVENIITYQYGKGLQVDGKLGERETLPSLRQEHGWMFDEGLKGKGKEGRQIIPHDATESERYDHFKHVVSENYGPWHDEPRKVNMMGISGMWDGKQVKNVVGQYNDTLVLAWIDENGNKCFREFKGTTEPGIVEDKRRINKKGVAHVKDGSYVLKLGTHTHRRGNPKELRDYVGSLPSKEQNVKFYAEKTYDALRQKSPFTVYRDRDLKSQEGHGYIDKPTEIKTEYRGQFHLNIHWGPSDGPPWSQGCGNVAGKDYNQFMGVVKGASNKDHIPYTKIDASKIPSMSKPSGQVNYPKLSSNPLRDMWDKSNLGSSS